MCVSWVGDGMADFGKLILLKAHRITSLMKHFNGLVKYCSSLGLFLLGVFLLTSDPKIDAHSNTKLSQENVLTKKKKMWSGETSGNYFGAMSQQNCLSCLWSKPKRYFTDWISSVHLLLRSLCKHSVRKIKSL